MKDAHIKFETATDKVARRITKMRPSAVRLLFAAAQRDDVISLAGGMPDVSLLPKSAVRKAAKAAKNYAEADAIRAALAAEGVTLTDTPQGTKFTVGEAK